MLMKTHRENLAEPIRRPGLQRAWVLGKLRGSWLLIVAVVVPTSLAVGYFGFVAVGDELKLAHLSLRTPREPVAKENGAPVRMAAKQHS